MGVDTAMRRAPGGLNGECQARREMLSAFCSCGDGTFGTASVGTGKSGSGNGATVTVKIGTAKTGNTASNAKPPNGSASKGSKKGRMKDYENSGSYNSVWETMNSNSGSVAGQGESTVTIKSPEQVALEQTGTTATNTKKKNGGKKRRNLRKNTN